MSKFNTQLEIWIYLTKGGVIYLKETPIKFIDGVLKSNNRGKWEFCPIAFENPRLFNYA